MNKPDEIIPLKGKESLTANILMMLIVLLFIVPILFVFLFKFLYKILQISGEQVNLEINASTLNPNV